MGDKETVRVVVVDDTELFRRGLVMMMLREADIEVTGEAWNGGGALSEMRRTLPDVVLLEVPMAPFVDDSPVGELANVELPRGEWLDLFTDQARKVVKLAQESARYLNDYQVGTEHILLGLIREGEGIAARALESLGISLSRVQGQIEEIESAGKTPSSDRIAFTEAAKIALELSVQEAPARLANHIETEHLLLGLVREKGNAAHILDELGADPQRVRRQITEFLSGVSGAVESHHWPMVISEVRNSFPEVGIVALISDDRIPELAPIAIQAGANVCASSTELVRIAGCVSAVANLNKPGA